MSTSKKIRGYSNILIVEYQILSNISYIFAITCVSLRMNDHHSCICYIRMHKKINKVIDTIILIDRNKNDE